VLQGAIFDLDGTLLDSMHIWETLGSDYLLSIGCKPGKDLNDIIRTFSTLQSARYFQRAYGVNLSEGAIVAGINRLIRRHYEANIQAKSGVQSFLERLERQGVRMCIATATDEALAKTALERLGLMKYFSGIFTAASAGAGKDRPDLYRMALANLGTEKEKTVVFEDALHALQTASRDGFITIAVYDKSEENQAFLRLHADCYISDYSAAADFWAFVSEVK